MSPKMKSAWQGIKHSLTDVIDYIYFQVSFGVLIPLLVVSIRIMVIALDSVFHTTAIAL